MDISKITTWRTWPKSVETWEKSKTLALLMNWKHDDAGLLIDENGETVWGSAVGGCTYVNGTYLDFYDPAEMSYAWRVLNWASKQTVTVRAQKGGGEVSWEAPWTEFIQDAMWSDLELFEQPPEMAQAAWLDAVLWMANYCGMLKEGGSDE